ncbi:MAG: hypothetical protein ACTH8F_00260 [Microbacterium sp.]|uniref:hypothetical protein n=1 Tax=Microbacterium sp. TaxID=51671 RepID=UPI003F97388C
MSRLSSGKYALIDDVLYRIVGSSASNSRNWVLEAVDPTVEPGRREIPGGTPGYKHISPSATYQGERVCDLVFRDDETILFRLWTDLSSTAGLSWPDGVVVQRQTGQHAGDNFVSGVAPFSEFTDFDDGFPEEWRPFLPSDDVDSVA